MRQSEPLAGKTSATDWLQLVVEKARIKNNKKGVSVKLMRQSVSAKRQQ
jgi:hypothetical protein